METKRQRIEHLIERGDQLAEERQTGDKRRIEEEEDEAIVSPKRCKWTQTQDDELKKLVAEMGKNWSEIAKHFPGRDRKRCRERFINHLESELNSSTWSKQEDEKLLGLQQEWGCKWADMARQFKGKSPTSLRNRFLQLRRQQTAKQHQIERRAPPQRWSKAEQDKLTKLVETHGARNWLFIASQLPGRTDLQCLQQWYRTLDNKIIKGKGTWTEKEDRVLAAKVKQIGRKWTEIAAVLPGRIGKQCRERYLNHLDPALSKTPWTAEEERVLLVAHAKYSTQWGLICKQLPGRSENGIKNWWYAFEQRQSLASGAIQPRES